jgi:hypothetical protein
MDKESWRGGGTSQPDRSVGTSFDEVAKGLANGTISRRRALTWMGGARRSCLCFGTGGGLGRRPMLRRADSLWRPLRKAADQRTPLRQLLQPLPLDPDLLQRQVRKPAEKREALW